MPEGGKPRLHILYSIKAPNLQI